MHEAVYGTVLSELVAFTKTQKVGNGSDPNNALGPIQNAPKYEKVLEYIEDCKEKGYRFATEGHITRGRGWFVAVTLVDNPPEESRVVRAEPFGQILPVMKWRDAADVIRRANDPE